MGADFVAIPRSVARNFRDRRKFIGNYNGQFLAILLLDRQPSIFHESHASEND